MQALPDLSLTGLSCYGLAQNSPDFRIVQPCAAPCTDLSPFIVLSACKA